MPKPLTIDQLKAKLKAAIEASTFTNASLARAIGADKDYVRDFFEGRKKRLNADALTRIEALLDLAPGTLFYQDGLNAEANYTIRVAGRIGAGAEILMDVEQVGDDGLFEIESTVPIPAAALAFEVEGDSMWPRYDPGDVVICGREGTDIDQIINWEAAVRTDDGRRYLKRVRRGSKTGLFDLESHNAAPIRDVKLEWAAEIAQVVRAGQWRRLDLTARKRLIARTMKR